MKSVSTLVFARRREFNDKIGGGPGEVNLDSQENKIAC
jgi:hypothetical protein